MRVKKNLLLLSILLAMVGSFCGPTIVFAAATSSGPTLNVPIGVLTSNKVNPETYINTIYKWGIGLAALLALGQLVVGGVMYTLSAGSIASRESATERIKNSIVGLVLLIAVVTILATLNPNLVDLKPIDTNSAKFQQDIKATQASGAQIDAARHASASFDKASRAAMARNAVNMQCKETADDLSARLDYEQPAAQANRARASGATQVAGVFIPVVGQVDRLLGLVSFVAGAPGTDFKSVLEAAQEAKGKGNAYLYHCMQDAVIEALGYARNTYSESDLVLVIEGLEALPADLEVSTYLNNDDPAGRNSVPVADMGLEFVQQNGITQQTQQIVQGQLDNKEVDAAIATIKNSYRLATGLTAGGAVVAASSPLGFLVAVFSGQPDRNAEETAVNYLFIYASDLRQNKQLSESLFNKFRNGVAAIIKS